MLAVGNVGESLVAYPDSDTFLTRNGGFSWEEVHKDAHMWEYGDQGSILLLVNDEDVTDRVTYTLDEGLTWTEYVFGERIRVRSIVTVPMDTSRKFILFGVNPDKSDSSIAVHLDFSSITNVKCEWQSRLLFVPYTDAAVVGKLDPSNPNDDDFELWSPSEEREELCLFGRQVRLFLVFCRSSTDVRCRRCSIVVFEIACATSESVSLNLTRLSATVRAEKKTLNGSSPFPSPCIVY
jgi:hypothetical protein